MSAKRKRVIGTTEDAIAKAENELGRTLPPSFREWLLANNGLSIQGADVSIFPIFDERDVRMTWDSIVRKYAEGLWFSDYFEEDERSSDHLLPFGADGGGNLYCFDYTRRQENGEAPVVWLSHETGDYDDEAETFSSFVENAESGNLNHQ